MSLKFNPHRNQEWSLATLFGKYDAKIDEMAKLVRAGNRAVLTQVGGKDVPPLFERVWHLRFIIGFKEDPKLAAAAFEKMMLWRDKPDIQKIHQDIANGMQPKDFPHAAFMDKYCALSRRAACTPIGSERPPRPPAVPRRCNPAGLRGTLATGDRACSLSPRRLTRAPSCATSLLPLSRLHASLTGNRGITVHLPGLLLTIAVKTKT